MRNRSILKHFLDVLIMHKGVDNVRRDFIHSWIIISFIPEFAILQVHFQ